MKSIPMAILLLGCAWPVSAQQETKPTEPPKTEPSKQEKMAGKDMHFLHKSKDIAGCNVKNPADENLGEIQELVLDPQTGSIEYAVISFGGFLGMGDKLFAVPWEVLQPAHDTEDMKDAHVVLNIDKERLKNSPGFPRNNWPDMASEEWDKEIREFYREDLQKIEKTEPNMTVRPLKASDVRGCNVETSDGKKAGEIEELVIDPNQGRVAYVVLKEGGFLGFGTDHYAVPWEAFTFTVDKGNDHVCKLRVPQAKFEKAPAYKDDDWKKMSDRVYVEEVYTYYGYPVYWTREKRPVPGQG